MIVRLHNLFAVVMLGGIYSLLAASIFVVFDAVDVAFTEAAVGAGISTVLLLGALALTTREERVPEQSSIVPLIIVFIVGSTLIYATFDMPFYGDPNAPIQTHVAPYYLNQGIIDTESRMSSRRCLRAIAGSIPWVRFLWFLRQVLVS